MTSSPSLKGVLSKFARLANITQAKRALASFSVKYQCLLLETVTFESSPTMETFCNLLSLSKVCLI